MPNEFVKPIGYSPFSRLVGFKYAKLDTACSQLVMEARSEITNENGSVHGGAIYSMVDVGMGAALYAHLTESERCWTAEIKINYLAAVTSGTFTCTSRVVHKGSRLAVIEADVKNGAKHIAKAMGTFYVFPAEGYEMSQSDPA